MKIQSLCAEGEAPRLSSLSTPALGLVSGRPQGRPPREAGAIQEVLCEPLKDGPHEGRTCPGRPVSLGILGLLGNAGTLSVRSEKTSRIVWTLRLHGF